MSAQLGGLARFLKGTAKAPAPKVGIVLPGQQECVTCGKWFSSQGIKNHKRMHIAKNDTIYRKISDHGPVKIRGPLYNKQNTGICLQADDDNHRFLSSLEG
mmetsp:Transcript_28516/g.60174  ORF Transcript_28516/g.60174 Transcript_28516/m.60174 type:complete len:101 (-) Transcript_28516:127-429(-)